MRILINYFVCSIMLLCGNVLYAQRTSTSQYGSKANQTGVMDSSAFWFVNTTNYSVTVKAERKYLEGNFYSGQLKPGDSVEGPCYMLLDRFADPYGYFIVWVEPMKEKKGRNPQITFLKEMPDPHSKQKRRYYYTIQ